MFFIWGSKWKYTPKQQGVRVNKRCPECHTSGEFFEVVPTKYFTVYWIPLFPTEKKEPVLECPNCREHIYLHSSDYWSAAKEPPPETSHIFMCESCGQKLRIPLRETLLKVTCPSCRETCYVRDGKRI